MNLNQGSSTSRKKVLFVITKSNFGGAQRYVYDLATNLPKDGFEVVVAFGGRGAPGNTPGTLARMLTDAGMRTIVVPELARDVHVGGDLAAFRVLIKLFKNEHPDVVHLNSSKAGGLGSLAARFARVPRIIFTAHGWPFWEDRNPLARALIFFFSYLTILFCHATICISEYDRRAMMRMPFARRKLHVVHNGISPIDFLPRDAACATLFSPAEIEAHSNDTWVLSNGELTDNKNYFVGIDAVAAYNATASRKTYYSIMGEGEQRQAIEAYIAQKHLTDHVKLLGFVPDGRRYYKAFDIFFLPSKKEGVPYVILETALAEIPIIASKAGGIPEVIEDGESGCLRASDDVAGFTKALVQLAESPILCEQIGKALERKIASDFSLPSMLEQTIALY